jgi:hypothetical protein
VNILHSIGNTVPLCSDGCGLQQLDAYHRSQRIIHAPQYLFVAKEHLRHCFGYPSRETLVALCVVALGSYYIDPRGTFYKYANFAIIIISELKQSLTVEQQRETWTASCVRDE